MRILIICFIALFYCTTSSAFVREAEFKDYLVAENTANQVYRDFDYYFTNFWQNRTYIAQHLLPIFEDWYAEDATIRYKIAPGLVFDSPPGPSGILSFALNTVGDGGEIHVFGSMVKQQVYPGDEHYEMFPFLDDPFFSVKKPVRIVLSAFNAGMTPLNETHIRQLVSKQTWIIDVSRCVPLLMKRNAVIRHITIEVFARTDIHRMDAPLDVSWPPITNDDAYRNPC